MDANTLLLAVAVALSPTGVLASVLLLTTDRGVRKAGAFALGWFLAVAVVGLLTILADSRLDTPPGSTTSTASAWLDVVLGAVLVVMAIRTRRRATAGPNEPSWMARLDHMPVPLAFGFGIFMPPYVIAAAAANSIVKGSGSSGTSPLAVVVTVVVSSLGVVVPWVVAVTASSADSWIASWRTWLLAHWPTVLSWLLLVIGAWLVVQGVAALL